VLDYAIVDFQDRKNLYVAVETRDAGIAETYVKDKRGSNCEVYYETESNGKLFRVICEKVKAKSYDPAVRTER